MLQFYRAIWRHTAAQQISLIALSVLVAALAAIPIDYQKRIINLLDDDISHEVLLWLGAEMLGVILLSLSLKWLLGYRTGTTGEGAIRFLRTLVVETADESTKGEVEIKRGTIANVISSETEAVGKFVGDSFAEPMLQFGTLVSVLGYIAFTLPNLAWVVIILIAMQAAIVLAVQLRINQKVKERVIALRRSVNRITSEELAAVKSEVEQDFDEIYEARRRVFLLKLSNKWILSSLNAVGLVFVLMYGGWLVLEDRSDVGSVVAATIALGRMQGPWQRLITYYRNLSAVFVQFELLRKLLVAPGSANNA
ncbi:MAG: ABC transporter transmembrane domain-containing protein [Pseudomonadota bacterium]